jgi:bifunctional enzyme CysN/CysC
MGKVDPINVCICGNVDEGKSTLLGRILFETQNIFLDQKLKLKDLSKRYGTSGGKIDYALAIDSLQAEREQGITIDVAYKFINYNSRRIIFCDSPGHKQYTKNVLTAASQCQAAIVLIDAKKKILEQTKRHIAIISFVGIKNIIFAINKLDLVGFKKKIFLNIKKKIYTLTEKKNFSSIEFIPISALKGYNITNKSFKISWFKKNNLLLTLSKIKTSLKKDKHSYISIQHVHRPNENVRHYMGIKIGHFKKNDTIVNVSSGQKTRIKNIFIKNKKFLYSNSIAFETKDKIDLGRGDIIVKKSDWIEKGDAFNASVCIISNDNLYKGRNYIIRIGNKETNVNINKIKNKLDIEKNIKINSKELLINDLGEIEFNCDDLIAFTSFDKNQFLGSFILIDTITNNTVAAGKINYALRKSQTVFNEISFINSTHKSILFRQTTKCIWLTGLSGSGKSTIAKALEKILFQSGKHVSILDADNLRLGINKDLGFSITDRIENIRRIAEIAKLMTDAGLIVIVACISPFANERSFARSLFEKNQFLEIFVNTPMSICKKRDSKNLYKKIKKNKLINPIGTVSGYEIPLNPDLEVDTLQYSANKIATKILSKL